MRLFRWILLGSLLLALNGPAWATPAGLVMIAKGKATVAGKTLKPKMPLNAGDVLELADGAKVLYMTTSGQKVLLKGPEKHTVGTAQTAKKGSVTGKAVALLSKGVGDMVDKDRDFKNKGGVGGVKRSGPEGPSLAIAYPLNSAILETRPTFRWQGEEGTYKVSLADDLGLDVFTEEVTGATLSFPEEADDLQPGGTYTLAVEGPAGKDSVRRTATFWLLTEDESRALQDDLQGLERELGDAEEARLTLEAALLNSLGMYHAEAERHQRLLKTDPRDEAALLQLLEAQQKMGDEQGAAATRDRLSQLDG